MKESDELWAMSTAHRHENAVAYQAQTEATRAIVVERAHIDLDHRLADLLRIVEAIHSDARARAVTARTEYLGEELVRRSHILLQDIWKLRHRQLPQVNPWLVPSDEEVT